MNVLTHHQPWSPPIGSLHSERDPMCERQQCAGWRNRHHPMPQCPTRHRNGQPRGRVEGGTGANVSQPGCRVGMQECIPVIYLRGLDHRWRSSRRGAIGCKEGQLDTHSGKGGSHGLWSAEERLQCNEIGHGYAGVKAGGVGAYGGVHATCRHAMQPACLVWADPSEPEFRRFAVCRHRPQPLLNDRSSQIRLT